MGKKDKLFEIIKCSPHVVLLGAGASVACIPDGDKNGKKTSCMKDFFETTGIDIGYIGTYKNLEDIYQDITDEKMKESLENKIRQYFDTLKLPDEPTIYDVLIISLTKKDLIASFNWDPLLIQALQRCHNITQDLPEVVFLHGNVWEWYAVASDGTMTGVFAQDEYPYHGAYIRTSSGQSCKSVPLLYPIKNKDYHKNNYIEKAWDIFQNRLSRSFMLTIFGYSGPKSDIEALNILKNGFLIKDKNGITSDLNNYKQLTIINIEKNIKDSFSELLDVPQVPFTEGINDYVEVLTDFWDENNWLLSWPRLTTEGYTITQYENKIPRKWPITIEQNNLTWDVINSIAKNQIKEDDL